jgi:hypothetical protein
MYLQIYTASHLSIITALTASNSKKKNYMIQKTLNVLTVRYERKSTGALGPVSDVGPASSAGTVAENEAVWIAAKYVDISYECSAHFPKSNKCDIP